jgi:hypothetical protein
MAYIPSCKELKDVVCWPSSPSKEEVVVLVSILDRIINEHEKELGRGDTSGTDGGDF